MQPRLTLVLAMVAAGARALSPLQAAKQAVLKGDQDGDSMLNEQEFSHQALTNDAFLLATFQALDQASRSYCLARK